jgi:2-keto-3-deoxy-galactonokinase
VEIAGATLAGRPQQVVIIGDEALSQRYARALALAGIASVRAGERATTLGQCLIARAAGLLGARP